MKEFRIENLLVKAKQAIKDIDKDWLKGAKEMAIQHYSRKFEKLPRLDLRDLKKSTATAEDPAIMLVEFHTDPKTVQTEKMKRPMDVVTLTVLKTTEPTLAPEGKYSVWLNTTVLAKEIHSLPKPLTGTKAIIAYYGQNPNKMGQMVYIYRAIPQE